MFRQVINGLKIAQDDFVQNVSGGTYRDDESLLATMRLLLHKRIGDESLRMEIYSTFADGSDLNFESAVEEFCNSGGLISIVSVDGRDEGAESYFKDIKNLSEKDLMGFKRMDDVAMFFEQSGKFKLQLLVNEEVRSSLIFVHRLNIQKFHLIAAISSRIVPWFFKDAPIEGDEIAIHRGLSKKEPDEFLEAVDNLSKQFDFRTPLIKRSLIGFETRFETKKLDRIREDIRNRNDQINNMYKKISQLLRANRDDSITQAGLEIKIRNGGGDTPTGLMEFFLINKALELVSVRGGRVRFIVNTHIDNYDPDLFDSLVNNRESFIYKHYRGKEYENKEMDEDRIEKLMRAIFETNELKLRVCGYYDLNFDDSEVSSESGYAYPPDILRTHIPNQHLHKYNCLGDNRIPITEALRNQDYVGAFMACIGSCSCMNMAESNTGSYFMTEILRSNEDASRCIELPNGTCVKPLDAVKWLEERENGKEE